MKKKSVSNNWIILLIILTSIFISNGSVLGRQVNNIDEGYGSYGMMGQDPDEILEYGRKMMRYDFHEGTGSTYKYPGYYRSLSNETIHKLNSEQKMFIKTTENLRQKIYEKELYLKVELAKKEPDKNTALSIQQKLSEARAQFEQLMVRHLISMKKINLEAETN